MRRPLATFLVVLLFAATTALARGRGKIIDIKSLPQGIPGLANMLGKPSKDQQFRTLGALFLDHQLRTKGTELIASDDVDALVTLVLDGAAANMVAPDNEIYTWEKDKFGPRSDVLCKEKILVFPGRVSRSYKHRVTVKMQGKRIDRGYLNEECTVTATAAKDAAEWYEWTGSQGWGINPFTAYGVENVARIGFAFYSPGQKGAAFPKLEKPTYVGFAARDEPDKDGGSAVPEWRLVAVEPVTAPDSRKQECNLFQEEPKQGEMERKLRIALWMESVRALDPVHETFSGQDSAIFQLNVGGADSLDPKKDRALLEPYLTSELPIVAAAAALKLARMSNAPNPSALADSLFAVKHPAAKTELMRAILPLLKNGVTASDEEKATLMKLAATDPYNLPQVKELLVFDDLAKMQVNRQRVAGYLFKKFPSGWQLLGPFH